MGRGTRQDELNHLRPGIRLNSREVIFKSASKGRTAVKQAKVEEAKKFAQARQRKEDEKNVPTEIDSEGNRFWMNSAGELHRDGDLPAQE